MSGLLCIYRNWELHFFSPSPRASLEAWWKGLVCWGNCGNCVSARPNCLYKKHGGGKRVGRRSDWKVSLRLSAPLMQTYMQFPFFCSFRFLHLLVLVFIIIRLLLIFCVDHFHGLCPFILEAFLAFLSMHPPSTVPISSLSFSPRLSSVFSPQRGIMVGWFNACL